MTRLLSKTWGNQKSGRNQGNKGDGSGNKGDVSIYWLT